MKDLNSFLIMVERFHEEILGTDIPSSPTILDNQAKVAARDHLCEELDEFELAPTMADQADALIDLIYVALGRLIEMGITPGPVFETVHAANMEKHAGRVAQRPNSKVDAVKPEGWEAPNLELLLGYDLKMLNTCKNLSSLFRRASEIRRRKGEDYNGQQIEIKDYFPFGHFSYGQMIHLKSLRMISLVRLIGEGKEPNFDGILDTLLDLVNYCAFYGEALEKNEL